ncbi:glucokinase [Sphingomonas sp.]|uniref:glucokinase n=1 Tax=Sphingomonas sp. TaxID=28214 RepID=UPI002DBBF402|nr:glucokinase [Sphingomonas sp.]HEU4969618.1 glucokinase [Sphingomonas sp.]
MDVVAVDIGGTHARFAVAELSGEGIALGPETVLKTGDYAGLGEAWRAFGERAGRPLPNAAGVAVAAPVEGDEVKLTNNDWVLRPTMLAAELGIERVTLVNDFAAVAHAVAVCDDDQLRHVCGPDRPLPRGGVISVVGPGTGLGVAMLVRGEVVATEGGHIGFAPADDVEDRLLARLRERYGRVSAERVACGAGLAEIYAVLTGGDAPLDDRGLWQQAVAGKNAAAAAALDRYCAMLGSVAGDLALAQGADAVVVAGGLGLRLAAHLPQSGFADRFVAKGRFETKMAALPVRLITYPQPGLLGAAAAFASANRA